MPMHSHTHALTLLAMGHGGLVWCSHQKAGCFVFYAWERTAVEQRQLIGRECSQLFNLRQTLITDARGQHLITSTPAFDVIVHPAHIYTAKAHQYVLFDAAECQFMQVFGSCNWEQNYVTCFQPGIGNSDGNHYYHHGPDLWYCACERCRVKVQ